MQSLFLRGEVYGTTHLYSGQEAVAVGFASALADGDRVACTYRGHGHLLAMGTDPEALLAELLGREAGVNGGRAGSMNVVDPDHGVLGCYGIVGGSIATATGAGLSLRGSGSVAVAYFGDGTVNQAYFFECLNFAKVMSLPVVFVCENNGYGEYTPFEAVTPGGIVARAAAFEVRTTEVDGMDVDAVRAAAGEVVARVRAGGGPEFVEARTYRFVGHSRSDPGAYRPEGELARWRERDPLDGRARAAGRRRGRGGRGRGRGRAGADRGGRARGAVPERALDLRVLRAPENRRGSVTIDIGMPRLSDSMEEATVLAWLKRPGDEVRRGEPLVEIETDKATAVYEAEADGVLDEIVAAEGETVALGAVIARLRTDRSESAGDFGPRARRPCRRERRGRAARGSPPCARRRARGGPERRLLRRGCRACGRRFRGDAGVVREVRPGTGLRHADLGARPDRRRVRRGDHGHASGARDHVRRLPGALDGRADQPGDEVLVPERRTPERAARRSGRSSARAAGSGRSTRRCRSRG